MSTTIPHTFTRAELEQIHEALAVHHADRRIEHESGDLALHLLDRAIGPALAALEAEPAFVSATIPLDLDERAEIAAALDTLDAWREVAA